MVAADEKTLFYIGLTGLISKEARNYRSRLVGLILDDGSYTLGTLALQKDSGWQSKRDNPGQLLS